MSATTLGVAGLVCLVAGAADVAVLNVVVLPSLHPAQAPIPKSAPVLPEKQLDRVPAPAMQQLLASSLAVAPVVAPTPIPQPALILDFDTSAHWVDARARTLLEQTLGRLQSASQIVVVGHADPAGPDELNERLSGLRAAAVARRLAALGIPRKHIRVEARGEREPRLNGNSRRVEIYLGGEQ